MRRIACQTGQTAAEYLGALVVVSVVIALLAATPAGATIRGQITTVVCKIAQRDGCGEPGPRDPGGPGDGPAFGDGPFPIPGLPWDGSVTITGNSNDSDGLYLEASTTLSTSGCRLDADGKPMVDLNVTGTLKAGSKYSEENAKGGVSVDGYLGHDVSYTISTDPDTAGHVQNHDGPIPNPIDPTSIPPGSAITLDEATYAGLDLSGSYRGIQAGMGYEKGRKVSSSVERVDANTVRVTVGDEDLVRSSLGLALGTDAVNVAVGADRELSTGRTRQVDIDLSSQAGQAAYAAFIRDGHLPDSGAGVSQARASQVLNYTGSTHLGGHLGPIDATLLDTDAVGTVAETTNPDGTISITQFARTDRVGITRQFTAGADGSQQGDATYALRLQGVDHSIAEMMLLEHGGHTDGFHGDQDVTLSFTDADLRRMHEAAIDQVYHRAHQADDEVEMAQALERMSGGDPNRLGQFLADFDQGTVMAHYGLDGIRHPDEHTGVMALPAPVFGTPAC